MSKDNKILPELRFPEFSQNGEWIETSLSEISPSIFDGTHQTPKYTDKGIPFFSVENIVSGNKNKFISGEDYLEATKKNKPEKGDVLVTRIGSIGIPKVVDWDYEFSIYVTLAVIKNSDQFIPQYLASYIQSSRFQKEILRRSLLKAAPQKINMNELRECEVLLPPDEEKAEQQKIASCLSSLDELLAAHNDKLDALKDHKKGLLQNLFPQEGETMPKVRFPEFEEDGEWVETKLDKHLEITSGYAFKSKFFSNSGRKLVTPKNFTKEGRANFIKEFTKYTTEDFKSKYLCKPGDLLVLLTDLTPSCELLGKPILLRNEDGEVLLNQRIIKLEVSKDLIKDFLFQFFLTSDFHRRVKSTASGTTVRHSSNKIILGTSLLIPRNTKEQKKIASFLSNLDELIEVQAQKIEQLQDHKKGMLQGLFPKNQF